MFWEVKAQDKAVRPVKSNWFIYQGIREQTNSEEKQESTNHAKLNSENMTFQPLCEMHLTTL